MPDSASVLRRLPIGSGVILRDYTRTDRADWAARLVALGRSRQLTVLVAGDMRLALAVRAGGVHWPRWHAGPGPARTGAALRPQGWTETASAHNLRELLFAARAGVSGVFLSPLFPTLSHPGDPALGAVRGAALAGHCPLPVFALGGVDAVTAARLHGGGWAGFGAIGAFLE